MASKLMHGYMDNKKNRPICITLLKMNGYLNSFKETKYMSFEIKNNKLLEKYNKICAKLNNIIEKASDVQLDFAKEYLKIKLIITLKTTYFFQKEASPENVNCTCITIILLDLVCKIEEKLLSTYVHRTL